MRRPAVQLAIICIVACVTALVTEASPELPVCDGCRLLDASDDATCSDLDPVSCKETDTEIIEASYPPYFDYDLCDLAAHEVCSLSDQSDECMLDHIPDDMQLELHYDGKSNFYGVKLTWPSLQLPCIENYYVLDYVLDSNGDIPDPYTSCKELDDQNPACAISTNDTTISFRRDLFSSEEKYITLKVAAYPVYIWSVTFKVGNGQKGCVARCGNCSCQYPSAPSNLTWMRVEGSNGTGRLSWQFETEPSPLYDYYLHVNSSISGKLLYQINGTESSVMLSNLVGDVSLWMESYSYVCGCSIIASQVLLIEADKGPVSIATSLTTTATTPFMGSSTSAITSPLTTTSSPTLVTSLLTPVSSTSPSTSPLPTAPSNPPVKSLATLIALPVALSLAILLVVLLVVSGVIVIQRHRHNAQSPKFLRNAKLCRWTFGRNDEKKEEESCREEHYYDKTSLSANNPHSYTNCIIVIDENSCRRNGYIGTPSPCKLPCENGSHLYVLLVFSQETPLEDQELILCYAQQLNKIVRVKMYDASDRLTRTAWLEEHYFSALAVLCVCNLAFAREWSNLSTPAGGSIVSAVKMMVQGKIEHQKRLEKFAVLRLHQEDIDHTPSYLKNVKSFLLSQQQIDSIAHYALSVKEFDY